PAIFRCASCQVELTGEIPLLQHVRGKKHSKVSQGRGFTGLLPNSFGLVPVLSDLTLSQLCSPGTSAAAGPGEAARIFSASEAQVHTWIDGRTKHNCLSRAAEIDTFSRRLKLAPEIRLSLFLLSDIHIQGVYALAPFLQAIP
ncbi:unnamed protein product, partial [Polarella glacialis]